MDDLRDVLRRRVRAVADVSEEEAGRIVDELRDAFDSDLGEFIASRHLELQRRGWRNEAIYAQIRQDLAVWRFSAQELTERQIRRRIYG